MKRTILSSHLVPIILLFISFSAFGQDSIPESFSGVIHADSLKQIKLYENAKAWILTKFMTADNLVQFDDKDHASIFVTGHLIMTKKKYTWGGAMGWMANTDNNMLTLKLELSFKDGKFKYDVKNILYSYDRHGSPQIEGHEQGPLNAIEGMPKKKVLEVEKEGISKIKQIIEEMTVAITDTKNKSDW